MFIAGVTRREGDGEGAWEGLFRQRLAEWGVGLGEDGVFSYNSSGLGSYEFIPMGRARQIFAGAPWLDAHCGCPFVGPALGFFAWQFWITGELDWWSEFHGEDNKSISIPILKEGRGVIAHAPSGRFGQAVHLRRLSLSWAIGKYALDDGAELLARDEPGYVRWVCDEVSRCLRHVGQDEGLVGWHPTHHNPLQWADEEAEVRALSEEEASRLRVDLWLYDFALLESEMFRGVHF